MKKDQLNNRIKCGHVIWSWAGILKEFFRGVELQFGIVGKLSFKNRNSNAIVLNDSPILGLTLSPMVLILTGDLVD